MVMDWWKELAINATFWLVFIGLLSALLTWWVFGTRVSPGQWGSVVAKLVSSPWLLSALIVVNALNVALPLYMSYVAPLDLMQDIASAEGLWRGGRMYDPHLADNLHVWLTTHPPEMSLANRWPRFAERERIAMRAGYFPPSHPPLTAVVLAPIVPLLGPRATSLAFNLFSLGALGLSLFLLRDGLYAGLSSRLFLAVAALVVGWTPVISLIRQSQSALVISVLMIWGWWELRRNRPVRAGVAIGLATALKLFPGLLLIYLLLRNRKAFASGLVTAATLFGLPLVLLQRQDFLDYSKAAQNVAVRWGASVHNLSILAFLRRDIGLPAAGHGFASAGALTSAVGILLTALAVWLVFRRSAKYAGGAEGLDLEYSLFLCLMPLLSPVVWDHYLTILLLPLAVVGQRVLAPPVSWPAVSGFLAIIVVLSIPILTILNLIWKYAEPRQRPWYALFDSLLMWAMLALFGWSIGIYRKVYVGGTWGVLSRPLI